MTESASPPPAEEQKAPRGLSGELLSLAGSVGRHVQALAALAGAETREAAGTYLLALVLMIAGLVLAIFGYAMLILFIAFLAALIFGISWLWISLVLAVLHFVGAAVCILIARNRAAVKQFPATSAELQKDFITLQNFKP